MLAFYTPGIPEIVVIAVVALLLFGKRLPSVGRNLGRGIVEFKRGLKDVKDDVDEAGSGKESDSSDPS